jgi:hypothetical protein
MADMLLRLNRGSLLRWLFFLLGFVVFAIIASVALQKRTAAQALPGGVRAHLRVPNSLTRVFGSTVVLEGEEGKRAGLFYGLNEAPLMLLAGSKSATVICIYRFNILDEVFVFDLNGRWYAHPPSRGEEYFDLMVPDTTIPFRKAGPDELRYALMTVRAMSESTYESVSVPTLDLGWYQWYAGRQDIEELIENKLQEESELE